MQVNEKILSDKIEHYRVEMIHLANSTSIKETEVIKISCILDKLINEYQRLKLSKIKQ